MSRADVSVIIPNFNRASIICETIDNMLAQSLSPLEIIVVDDGSTDNSVNVISAYSNRVKLLQQVNKGPGAARNAGLKVASGEFIQFMDSDDLASLNKLEVQVKALVKQNADVVYGPWVRVWKDQNVIQLENVVLQQAQLPQSRSPLCWFLNNWSMVFQQCLVRRTLLQRVGGYREDYRSFEDGDLFVRLLLAGGKLTYESDTLTFYRLDDFNKLTGSGQQQSSRTKDEACFYADLLNLLESNPLLEPCLQHRAFITKVRNVIQQMKKTGISYNDHCRRLYDIGQKYSWVSHVQHWMDLKRSGLQQIFLGHRWPGCYKVGPINIHQINLISELSLDFAR